MGSKKRIENDLRFVFSLDNASIFPLLSDHSDFIALKVSSTVTQKIPNEYYALVIEVLI